MEGRHEASLTRCNAIATFASISTAPGSGTNNASAAVECLQCYVIPCKRKGVRWFLYYRIVNSASWIQDGVVEVLKGVQQGQEFQRAEVSLPCVFYTA